MESPRVSWFVKRDIDGFFGLFVDNLVQLLLIVELCAICGIGRDSTLLVDYILPGAAISILVGNLFYAWQARRVALRENRGDVTALPYGINTPSLLVYVFFVMQPVYHKTGSAETAWLMGLIACLGSGLIEFAGAFVAESIRKRTPRAALLSTLAGIAIGFISMKFALELFHRPLVSMPPLAIILLTYFSRVGFPLGLPGGFVAVLLGTLSAWVLPAILPVSLIGPAMDAAKVSAAWNDSGWHLPHFAGAQLWEILKQPAYWIGFVSVIIPMGLFNVIGSLQNIESAEAAGDRFDTPSSLAVNGIGTILAALFGSCFPTTIYIGHPGWKGMGARSGYSTLNGLVIAAICLSGTVGLISSLIPIDAGMAIVLWIGIIITAQAFQATPSEHAPAVAVGLFPAIAAWGATVVQGAFIRLGIGRPELETLQSSLEKNIAADVSSFMLHGMIAMERGYIFTCMILAAVSVCLIERKFYAAAAWSLAAGAFTAAGLMHAYQLQGNSIDFLFAFSSAAEGALAFRAYGILAGYLMFSAVFGLFGWYQSRNPELSTVAH